MSKKVLIFSLAYHPFVGGAEVAMKEITDRIDSDDISFDMVTLRFDRALPKVEMLGNITVHRIGFTTRKTDVSDLSKPIHKLNKLLFPIWSTVVASRLHRKNKYNGIWAMMANYAGFGALFFKVMHPRVPYLLTLQEGDPIEYIKKKVRFARPLFRRIFTRADVIQVISSHLGRFARDMGYKGSIEIVPNAVNVRLFSQKQSGEKILHKKEGDVYLVTTSRLVTKNALDDVINALALLSENIHFVILGIGPDEEKLKKLARIKKVEGRVHFVGQVSYEDIPKYLHESDIFIRPSLSEGFGNSFVEAMAAGVPVIATQKGGIADFLFDPDCNPDKPPTGRAVQTRDPEGIAHQIERYLNDTNVMEEIVSNAQKMVAEKYDWGIIAQDMKERVFKSLLS